MLPPKIFFYIKPPKILLPLSNEGPESECLQLGDFKITFDFFVIIISNRMERITFLILLILYSTQGGSLYSALKMVKYIVRPIT